MKTEKNYNVTNKVNTDQNKVKMDRYNVKEMK